MVHIIILYNYILIFSITTQSVSYSCSYTYMLWSAFIVLENTTYILLLTLIGSYFHLQIKNRKKVTIWLSKGGSEVIFEKIVESFKCLAEKTKYWSTLYVCPIRLFSDQKWKKKHIQWYKSIKTKYNFYIIFLPWPTV